MELVAIHVGQPKVRPRPERPQKSWRSGIYKRPVMGPVRLRFANLDGDRQADLRVHGGPNRAVLIYGAGHYRLWAAELGRVLPFGSFGENFTVTGFDEEHAHLGDIYAVGGEAIVQLTQPRGPCYKLQYRTEVPDMIDRVLDNGRGGIYARVLQEGMVKVGDPLQLLVRGEVPALEAAASQG